MEDDVSQAAAAAGDVAATEDTEKDVSSGDQDKSTPLFDKKSSPSTDSKTSPSAEQKLSPSADKIIDSTTELKTSPSDDQEKADHTKEQKLSPLTEHKNESSSDSSNSDPTSGSGKVSPSGGEEKQSDKMVSSTNENGKGDEKQSAMNATNKCVSLRRFVYLLFLSFLILFYYSY